jgi:hypothetical protein
MCAEKSAEKRGHSAFWKRYTRADADAMIQHVKTPMEDARQTDALLNAAADRTRQ